MYITYEAQYIDNLKRIYYTGEEELNERTGILTRRLPATQLVIDCSKEFPILQSKKVNWKVAVKEILWIMQKHSNRVSELGSKIWDAWADEHGTIGRSYGYQIGRDTRGYTNQVDYILDTLKHDPSNRQCVIDMWCVEDLDEMNLVPCCYSSVWSIIQGELHCMLVQRSADYPIGVPFDTTQYAALLHMFARHLCVKPGMLTHVMADSHIYANQYEGVEKQLFQYSELKAYSKLPKFIINDNAHNFWDMSIDDFDIIDYNPQPAIKFEVAV